MDEEEEPTPEQPARARGMLLNGGALSAAGAEAALPGHAQPRPGGSPVKMSTATKAHLAWPCLPVLEVDTSTTWGAGKGGQGRQG